MDVYKDSLYANFNTKSDDKLDLLIQIFLPRHTHTYLYIYIYSSKTYSFNL